MRSGRGVYQSEDVVEDEVAAGAVGEKLEGLCVAHGLLLLVDLRYSVSECSKVLDGVRSPKVRPSLTPGYRQTRWMAEHQSWILDARPSGMEGSAKGVSVPLNLLDVAPYRELLDYVRGSLDCRVFERQHGLVALFDVSVGGGLLEVLGTHVERSKLCPILVEGVVVELDKLLWEVLGSWSLYT